MPRAPHPRRPIRHRPPQAHAHTWRGHSERRASEPCIRAALGESSPPYTAHQQTHTRKDDETLEVDEIHLKMRSRSTTRAGFYMYQTRTQKQKINRALHTRSLHSRSTPSSSSWEIRYALPFSAAENNWIREIDENTQNDHLNRNE